MRVRLALLIVPLLLASLLPAAVAVASVPGVPGVPALPDAAAQRRAAVVAYWTPERMAAAVPRDVVFDGTRGHLQRLAKPPAKPTRPPRATPTPTPRPTPTPTPDLSANTLGSSWTGGGIMLTATGRVYFVMDNQAWICSGSVITDISSEQSIVLTAGHCVVGNDAVFATNWMFIPSFDTSPSYTCASATYGCWAADALYADASFAEAGSFNITALQHDWGFAVVGTGGNDGSQLDAQPRGSLGIDFNVNYAGQKLSGFGYPAAAPYTGTDLVYCRGAVSQDLLTLNTTWSLPCSMTGGASGGPWVRADSTTTYAGARAGSVNSYKYNNDANHMYGPKFNSDAQKVFDAATSGSLPASGVVRVFLP